MTGLIFTALQRLAIEHDSVDETWDMVLTFAEADTLSRDLATSSHFVVPAEAALNCLARGQEATNETLD